MGEIYNALPFLTHPVNFWSLVSIFRHLLGTTIVRMEESATDSGDRNVLRVADIIPNVEFPISDHTDGSAIFGRPTKNGICESAASIRQEVDKANKERDFAISISPMAETSNGPQKLMGFSERPSRAPFSPDAFSMSPLRAEIDSSAKALDLQKPKPDIATKDAMRKISDVVELIRNEKESSSIVDSARMMVTDITSIVGTEGANWPEDPPYAHFAISVHISNISEPSIWPIEITKYRNRMLSKSESVACDIRATLRL